MKHVSEFEYEVIENPDFGVEMPDGIRLSARTWIPKQASQNPVPAILEFLPYRKRDGTIERDEFSHPWMAGHGYACFRVDLRGTGESEGLLTDEYTQQELDDACFIIDWLANQDWCNGNVGMTGISWGGFNSLQVAAMAPKALRAVIVNCATVDRYADDIHYKGGCLLGANFSWASQMLSYTSRPPDPVLVGDQNWLEMWKHRLENLPLLWRPWHEHQHRTEYWKHGSVCEDYSSIKAAVLSINGWHDGYRNTVSHLVTNVDAPVKGIIGPWIHKYPHYAGPKPAIGYLQEAKRWWDCWLKGIDSNVESDPDMRIWLMDSIPPKRWYDERPGRWIAENEWPTRKNPTKRFHFTSSGLGPAAEELSAPIVSPLNCGQNSGEYFPFAFSDEFAGEQSADDALSLCFDGSILDTSIDIVGSPVVHLALTSEKPVAQICVRLCDLQPDGQSALITYGVLNLAHHDSHDFPKPLKAGETIQLSLDLDQIGYRLPAGHRLRVAVSNSYWPFVWPSPEKSDILVLGGSIDIPIGRYEDDNEWEFEEPEGSLPWEREKLRKSSFTKETYVDGHTGETITTLDCNNGENRDLHHDLISGSWTQERWSIHPDEPSSAKSEIRWEQTGGRERQMWRTEIHTKMWCDKDSFFTTANVRCWLNDEIFFDRDYRDNVKRDLV